MKPVTSIGAFTPMRLHSRQIDPRHQDADQADRNIDQKDPVPAEKYVVMKPPKRRAD
jgi:hypothetical protein